MKNWLGYDYISKEGNEILKKALCHYKMRLSNITQDKTVIQLGASFVGLFDQEAQKTLKNVNEIIKIVETGEQNQIKELEHQISILEKALNCLKYDLSKSKVSEEPKLMKDYLPKIEIALLKIKEYS